MIEYPEAVVIAGQIDESLTGKRIESAVQGFSPHKWAFTTATPEAYAERLAGREIVGAVPHGGTLKVRLDDGQIIVLGGGGERILYHEAGAKLPKKHQLLLNFVAGDCLTVAVQGWGSVMLFEDAYPAEPAWLTPKGPAPLDEGFTAAYVDGLIDGLGSEARTSVKAFVINEPGIWGLGNGYLQDIAFGAGLHPRRKVVGLSADERVALHACAASVVRRAWELQGRDTERDLYNEKGRYVRQMDSRTKGEPCPRCGTPIEKIAYLGGACYFCPQCQPLDQ